MMEQLAWTSRDFVLWLSGYYHGKRDNTIIEPETIKKNADEVKFYCYKNPETTVMDAVKNVLGDK
jgi:acid stress chaperone HdeB